MIDTHCKNGDIEKIKAAFEQFGTQAVLNARKQDDVGRKCIHEATANGQTETVKQLLDCGADIEEKNNNESKKKEKKCGSSAPEPLELLACCPKDDKSGCPKDGKE